jgi:ATP synthase mitochondrial F1 complex assembly factor 2
MLRAALPSSLLPQPRGAARLVPRTECWLRSSWCQRQSIAFLSASSAASTSSSAASAPKVQLAGRRRFYRHVSILPAAAPWIVPTAVDAEKGPSSTVPSPISAGVDGTDSATGVVVVSAAKRQQRGTEYYRRWLQPRHPDGRQYQSINTEGKYTGTINGDDDDATTTTTTTTTTNMSTWHAVCLDGKALQTPAKSKLLAVPSRALAAAIASEWDSQSRLLKPAQMPLTTLACTILDQVCEQPRHYQQSVLGYVGTDTLRYWADPTHDPTLFNEQERLWTPVLGRLGKILDRDFPTHKADSNVIIFGKMRQSRAHANLHDDAEIARQCRQWVEALDAWHLGLLYSLTVEAKSFGLAMAFLRRGSAVPQVGDDGWHDAAGFETPEDHFIASSRVEEEVQISQWGMVEGGHDYDRLNCAIQVRAASFLRQCLDHELCRSEMS